METKVNHVRYMGEFQVVSSEKAFKFYRNFDCCLKNRYNNRYIYKMLNQLSLWEHFFNCWFVWEPDLMLLRTYSASELRDHCWSAQMTICCARIKHRSEEGKTNILSTVQLFSYSSENEKSKIGRINRVDWK